MLEVIQIVKKQENVRLSEHFVIVIIVVVSRHSLCSRVEMMGNANLNMLCYIVIDIRVKMIINHTVETKI